MLRTASHRQHHVLGGLSLVIAALGPTVVACGSSATGVTGGDAGTDSSMTVDAKTSQDVTHADVAHSKDTGTAGDAQHHDAQQASDASDAAPPPAC